MESILLSPLGTTAFYSLIGLLIGFVFIGLIVWLKPMPSTAKYASLGILIAVAGLFVVTLYKSFNSTVSWDNNHVMINIPLYKQTLARSDVYLQQAYLADLSQPNELTPTLRTNGMGLPGYSLGWFKLSNGDKGLLSVTERNEIIAIPTNLGYTILLSAEAPVESLQKLQTAD